MGSSALDALLRVWRIFFLQNSCERNTFRYNWVSHCNNGLCFFQEGFVSEDVIQDEKSPDCVSTSKSNHQQGQKMDTLETELVVLQE